MICASSPSRVADEDYRALGGGDPINLARDNQTFKLWSEGDEMNVERGKTFSQEFSGVIWFEENRLQCLLTYLTGEDFIKDPTTHDQPSNIRIGIRLSFQQLNRFE